MENFEFFTEKMRIAEIRKKFIKKALLLLIVNCLTFCYL